MWLHKFFSFRFFLILTWILYVPVPVFSQFSSSVRYDKNNGFISNTAYFVIKDKDGYLWITTDKGVVKYDGYNFNVFTTEDGLSDNENFEAYEDSYGRIWFSAYNGIPSYYYKGKFHSLKQLFESNNIHQNGPTYKIMEAGGFFWILNRKTLYKYSPGCLVKLSSGKENFISMSFDEKRKRMIVLIIGKKALTVGLNNRVDSLFLPGPFPGSITKSLILNDKLFYSSYSTLVIKDLESTNYKRVELNKELLCIVNSDEKNKLFIGSTNCLYQYDLKNETLSLKFGDQKNISGIMPGYGYSYWCTSLDGGLSFIGNKNVQLLNDRNVLPFEYVHLIKKIKNKLIITSDRYRVCIYDLKTQKTSFQYSRENKDAGRGLANGIRTNNNNTYVNFSRNLLEIDPNGNILEIPLELITYDLFYNGKYYFGLHLDRISRALNLSGIIELPSMYESMNVNARHLFYDQHSNNMYAYSNHGLYVTNVDSFNRIRNFYSIPELSTNISTVTKFSDSILIVGTTINGIHFLKGSKLLGSISSKQGLSSNNVSCVMIYKDEIWVGTDNGINVLRPGNKSGTFSISYLGKKDGIFSSEINCINIENDTVYAASPQGLFYFDKNKISHINELPVLNIDYIKFGTRSIDTEEKSYLPSSENNLKVKFTGISFTAMGNLLYRYKLDPIDKDWNYTNGREIEYPVLKPGSYKLRIQCRVDKSIWSKMRTIEFVIKPALHQRSDIKIFVAMLVLITIILLIDWRIRTINKQHELKEKLLELEKDKLEAVRDQAIKEKEIIELEQQALRLHMNPHFVFNAINAIQGFYAGNEVGKAKQFISYFSRLLRLILETSREKLIPLSTEVEIIKNYLELFLLRFEDKYTYEITFDDWEDEQFVLIPPMIIQPFVENAVLHGISPLKSKGKIHISLTSENNYLVATISDNGIGRKRSQELKMSSRDKSTGIKVAKMRLKNLNTDPAYDKNVEIIDLEKNGEPDGTLVILRIPLNRTRDLI